LNFRLPYCAVSPVDFWRRWHISLSSWLRDYLYISLGGNQNNRFRNVMITMLLGGLWHGAAWTFVVWGAFHGVIIAATHYLSKINSRALFVQPGSRGITFFKWLITFYLVSLGWVLFRASSLDSAWEILIDLHTFNGSLPEPSVVATTIMALTVSAVFLMHLMDYYVIKGAEKLENSSWLFWLLLVAGQTLCLLIGEPSNEFIYFQF